MTKLQEKLIEARKTGVLYFDQIMAVKDEAKKRLEATLKAYGVIDAEDIEDASLRNSATDLEEATAKLADLGERIWHLMDKVYEIDLSQY